MKKRNQIILFFAIGLVFLATSCRGVKVKHGKDCGCGSFGQTEQSPNQPQ